MIGINFCALDGSESDMDETSQSVDEIRHMLGVNSTASQSVLSALSVTLNDDFASIQAVKDAVFSRPGIDLLSLPAQDLDLVTVSAWLSYLVAVVHGKRKY